MGVNMNKKRYSETPLSEQKSILPSHPSTYQLLRRPMGIKLMLLVTHKCKKKKKKINVSVYSMQNRQANNAANA